MNHRDAFFAQFVEMVFALPIFADTSLATRLLQNLNLIRFSKQNYIMLKPSENTLAKTVILLIFRSTIMIFNVFRNMHFFTDITASAIFNGTFFFKLCFKMSCTYLRQILNIFKIYIRYFSLLSFKLKLYKTNRKMLYKLEGDVLICNLKLYFTKKDFVIRN